MAKVKHNLQTTMNNHKILSLSLLTSILVLAGCTQTQTTSTINATVNENTLPAQTGNVEVATNTNETVSNENTNTTNESGEVDTANWQTYTNEEYGFSFKYPKDWGEVVVTTREADEFQTGSITQIIFDNDRSRNGIEITAVVKVETIDYQFTGPSDGENILFSKLDLTQTEDQLQETLKRDSTIDSTVTKITTLNNMSGLVVDETIKSLGGEEQYYVEYLFPKFNSTQTLNIRIYGEKETKQTLESLVDSLVTNS